MRENFWKVIAILERPSSYSEYRRQTRTGDAGGIVSEGKATGMDEFSWGADRNTRWRPKTETWECLHCHWGFSGGANGKEPTSQCKTHKEMWVWSPSREDPLEEGIATYSSILVWRLPRTEESGRLQSMVSQSQTQLKQLSTHTRTMSLPFGFQLENNLGE